MGIKQDIDDSLKDSPVMNIDIQPIDENVNLRRITWAYLNDSQWHSLSHSQIVEHPSLFQ